MTTVTAPIETGAPEMRRLRREMLDSYAGAIGRTALSPRTVRLPSGDAVQVDGADEHETVIVETVLHTDATAEGLRAGIAQAVLSLSLIRRVRPEADLVLLVANEDVRRAAAAWVPTLDGRHPVRLVAAGA